MRVLMLRGVEDDLELLGLFESEEAALLCASNRGWREVILVPWAPDKRRLTGWAKV